MKVLNSQEMSEEEREMRFRGAVIAAFLFVVIVGSAGYYYFSEPAGTPTTATPTTAIVRSYDLVDAVNEGVIEVEIRGTGYAAGDVIRMKITPRLDISIDIQITPGLILINSGSGQSMIIAEARTIAVKPNIKLDFIIEAYCLDPDKDNPSYGETFSIQNVPGIYGQDVIRLMKSLAQLPRSQRPVAAIQIAAWVITDDISEEDIRIDFSSGDIQTAKRLLQNAGIDISGKRLFPTATAQSTTARSTSAQTTTQTIKTNQTIKIQTSNTFVQTLSSPGATSQGEWKTIATFTGSGDTDTADFTVLTDYWRIVYTVKAEDTQYAFFAAFVYPSGETTRYVAHLRWDPPELTTEERSAGPGDFWIEVSAANLESWTIEVQTQQ